MPRAHTGKRLLNLPQAAEYSAWSYERGVEHGRREMQLEMMQALESLSEEAKKDLERELNEKHN
jgi:uncharacterized protein (DUF3820 family)